LGAASWWLAGRSLIPTQRAWEQQQTFVANASHELRTPVTLMRASAEVALRGLPAPDVDRRELLEDILHECDHMSRLVEDLLLLSRLDAGRLKLERSAVPLAELLADVQRQTGRLAGEKGVRLSASSPSGIAWGDPTRLRQVLLILLDNALRHTPPGGSITVEAQPQGRHIQIAVADTGTGIAREHLPHVFERFYRADTARGGDGGSSGLGLAIAKGLVEAQGGQIRLGSQPGRGTRVVVTLLSTGSLD
jgi:signal transduction histidine kinase